MKNLADVQMPGDAPSPDKSLAGVQMFDPVARVVTVTASAIPPGYRPPTKDEQIRAWEKLIFEINLNRAIAMNPAGVEACLKRIDAFVDAHKKTEILSDAIIKARVIQAFWEKIALDPAAGLTKVAVDVETYADPKPKKAPVKRAKRRTTTKKPKSTTGAKRGRKPKAATVA